MILPVPAVTFGIFSIFADFSLIPKEFIPIVSFNRKPSRPKANNESYLNDAEIDELCEILEGDK